MNWKLVNHPYGGEAIVVARIEHDDSITFVPKDPANTDYAEYLKWLDEGNEPLPAETPDAS